MKEKFLKTMGFGITVFFTVIGWVSAIVTVYSSSNIVKTFSQFITYVCIAIVALMIVMYLITWFESRMKNDDILEKIAHIESQMDSFSSLSNITSQVSKLEQNIVDLKEGNIKIHENIQNLNSDPQTIFCPVKTSSYVENSEDVNNELYKLLKEKKKELKELHIICFGRNGFGGAVKYIIDRRINIKVKIIVFNPESHSDICQADDNVIIKRNIETWLKGSNNIEVIVSEIPPMVRAAVAYAADKDSALYAVWGSIQSYRFALNPDTKAISLEKPSNSLISICEEHKTVAGDLYALANSFEEEFKRLEKHSQTVRIISKAHGKREIIFEEKKP